MFWLHPTVYFLRLQNPIKLKAPVFVNGRECVEIHDVTAVNGGVLHRREERLLYRAIREMYRRGARPLEGQRTRCRAHLTHGMIELRFVWGLRFI